MVENSGIKAECRDGNQRAALPQPDWAWLIKELRTKLCESLTAFCQKLCRETESRNVCRSSSQGNKARLIFCLCLTSLSFALSSFPSPLRSVCACLYFPTRGKEFKQTWLSDTQFPTDRANLKPAWSVWMTLFPGVCPSAPP